MIVTEDNIKEIPEGSPVSTPDENAGSRIPFKRFGKVRHVGPWHLIEDLTDKKVKSLVAFSKGPIFTFLLEADYKIRQPEV